MVSLQTIFGLLCDNLLSFTLLLVIFFIIKKFVLKMRLPAGPMGLPIVGYLPFLGKQVHRDIAKLSAKYGNVFTLQLGVNDVVILNDFAAVKDAFSKDSMLGRPFNGTFSLIGTSSFVDDDGPVWREHRRFSMQVLRDLGFGKGSMEDRISEEVGYLLELIDKTCGKPADIHKMLVPSVSNIISQLVFGHRFQTDEPKRVLLDKMLEDAQPLYSSTGLVTTSPRWFTLLALILGFLGKKKDFDDVFSLFENEILNHKKNFNENIKRDYIDGYLAEMKDKKKKDPNTSFTFDKLQANCFVFFGAGSEPVRTTTDWCLLIAVNYPEYQKRIQDEIDEMIGNQRSVCWDDRLRMPFTQAFINEVLRWKQPLPINLYRRAIEDTHVLNHFIPKDTLILANIWAVHNDPKLWDKPEQFNPDRFLTDDGKELKKIDYFVPFALGKRSCVGETLARTEIFLYFASILQRYTVSAPNGQKIWFEEKFGLSLQPTHYPPLVFNKRV